MRHATALVRRLTAALALAACAPHARPTPAVATPASPAHPLHLFLLAGQSNMAGRGYVEAEDRVPHARVWMLTASGRWVPAVDPVHFDKPSVAGVGPGRAFGVALADCDTTLEIGLVPAAVGGSAISAWEPGALDAATHTHPYDDAMARARAALGTSPGARFDAVLWHQGESDANPRASPLYEARLRALVQRFRADLGDSTLPVIVGEVGHFADRPWTADREAVTDATRRVAASTPRMAFVSSERLAHRGDSLHFSAPAARTLGRRYAAAWARLTGACGGTIPTA